MQMLAVSPQVTPGRDNQLWVLPRGATRPESLGILRPADEPPAPVPPPEKPSS